jgi:hypothetical protein
MKTEAKNKNYNKKINKIKDYANYLKLKIYNILLNNKF